MTVPTTPPWLDLTPPQPGVPICRYPTCGKRLFDTDKLLVINSETAFHVDCGIRMGIELIAVATGSDPSLLPVVDNLLKLRFGSSVASVIPIRIDRRGKLVDHTMNLDGEYCLACGAELSQGQEVKAYIPDDESAAVLYFDPECTYALGTILRGE